MALFAFLVTSLVASQLASRARHEAEEAQRRRREIERLYSFSQRLLVSGNVIGLLNAIPNHIVETFGVGAAALYLDYKQKFYHSGAGGHFNEEEMKRATGARRALYRPGPQPLLHPRAHGVRAPSAAWAFPGALLSRQTLEALGTLIAVAFERARAVEELGKTEASREGERLKSALLDSVTHDFRTPLTSIKASVTSLLSTPGESRRTQRELLTVIDEECDRLNQLVGDAAEMARLDAGEFELQLEPQPRGRDRLPRRCRLQERAGQPHRARGDPGRPAAGAGRFRTDQGCFGTLDRECQRLYAARTSPLSISAEAAEIS